MVKNNVKPSNQNSGVLTQVAEAANVSTGTVSRVFNNSSLIPDDTRNRVLSAARELGFRPRVGVRNKQIALVTEPPTHTIMGGYVNSMTQYISFALSRAGAGITLVTEDRINSLSNCWFDGIIGIAWEESTVKMLKQIKNMPIVWLSDNYADSFHSIYSKAESTGRMAGEYLFSKGHKNIAIIHDDDYTGRKRVAGLTDYITSQDVCANVLAIANTQPLHLSVKQILSNNYSAIWVTGVDMKALEVSWLVQELAGKKIPEDISLLGFENPGISEFLRPSLTTIVSPFQEMANYAVEIVLSDSINELQKIEFSEKIIERASIRNLKI